MIDSSHLAYLPFFRGKLWFQTVAGFRDRGAEAGAAGGQERHREGDAQGPAERDGQGGGRPDGERPAVSELRAQGFLRGR